MALESQLLNRSLGDLSQPAFQSWFRRSLIDSILPASGVTFDSSGKTTSRALGNSSVWAHKTGANAIAIDRIEGQFLVSGGADASLHLWDLTDPEPTYPATANHIPLLSAPRNKHAHTHGVTSLSFYPFDSDAILSSSYDHSLKISSTHTLSPTASFSLGSVVYAHAMSPVAQHVLVACATQSSVVRLVDLRSGAMTQGLIGHQGDVFNVSWSPKTEHALVSAGTDGTARLWDIRRSAAAVGMFDLEDETGLLGSSNATAWGRAHVGACNAVAWTANGNEVLTAGHDERIRVWDAATGRNTLVHFGPSIRNKKLAAVSPLLINEDGRDILLWPNEREIIVGDLQNGRILRKLRPHGISVVAQGNSSGTRIVKERVSGLAWRGAGYTELYSSHADGIIRAWLPAAQVQNDNNEQGSAQEGEDDENMKKRKALAEIHRDLTRHKITFT